MAFVLNSYSGGVSVSLRHLLYWFTNGNIVLCATCTFPLGDIGNRECRVCGIAIHIQSSCELKWESNKYHAYCHECRSELVAEFTK